MIRFGVVLPTFIYNEYRKELAAKAFETLLLTRQPTAKPIVTLVLEKAGVDPIHPEPAEYDGYYLNHLIDDESEAVGTEQTLAAGTQTVFDGPGDISHVVWMGDDSLFHPDWLRELEYLIDRHPDAKGWSVYRSAYEAAHRTLLTDATGDCRVSSLCGHGFTISREEWTGWGIDWRNPPAVQGGQPRWPGPEGNTLDILHPFARPGERWCTGKSYVQHTGRRGVNCTPDIPEWAVDFQGEQESPTWSRPFLGGGSHE